MMEARRLGIDPSITRFMLKISKSAVVMPIGKDFKI